LYEGEVEGGEGRNIDIETELGWVFGFNSGSVIDFGGKRSSRRRIKLSNSTNNWICYIQCQNVSEERRSMSKILYILATSIEGNLSGKWPWLKAI